MLKTLWVLVHMMLERRTVKPSARLVLHCRSYTSPTSPSHTNSMGWDPPCGASFRPVKEPAVGETVNPWARLQVPLPSPGRQDLIQARYAPTGSGGTIRYWRSLAAAIVSTCSTQTFLTVLPALSCIQIWYQVASVDPRSSQRRRSEEADSGTARPISNPAAADRGPVFPLGLHARGILGTDL